MLAATKLRPHTTTMAMAASISSADFPTLLVRLGDSSGGVVILSSGSLAAAASEALAGCDASSLACAMSAGVLLVTT